MNLLGFFKRRSFRDSFLWNNPAFSESGFSGKPSEPGVAPYCGDLRKTMVLKEAFKTPVGLRDAAWHKRVFTAIAEAGLICKLPHVMEDADGFPYLHMGLPSPGIPFECRVLRFMVDDFLLEKGCGVAVFSGREEAELRFTYGDVFNFHLRDTFSSDSSLFLSAQPESVFGQEEDILIGPPSETVLPKVARAVLRNFLSRYYSDPRVALVCRNGMNSHELVFNCGPKKFSDERTFHILMKKIAWFLPRDYAYCAMDDRQGDFFRPL